MLVLSDIKVSWVEEKRLEIFFSTTCIFSSLSYKFQTVKSIVGDILYFKALFLLSAKINFNLA